ncbi:chitinase N-terminal domain-containing protein [Chitinibacteraceae bacterium HSL-7]
MKSWMVALMLPALAHGQIMTPEEAEAAGDVVCKPADKGLLDCRPLSAPVPVGGNDPSLVPLPVMTFSGEQYGAEVDLTPSQPVIDLLPSKLPARTATIAWDVGWGNVGDYWEVWDNDQLLLRSRTFTQRKVGSEALENSKDIAQSTFLAVQSGVHTVERLSDGRHDFVVKLCKQADKPKCSVARTTTWVGAEGDSEGEGDATPSKPELAWVPQITTGEAIDLRWNLWWGTPGTYWQLMAGKQKVFESRQFSENDAHSQAGVMTLTSLAAGKHTFSVRLCKKLICTESEPVTVEVMLPVPMDVKPRVVVRRVSPDTVIMGWSVPRLSYAKAPISWLLKDATADQVLGEAQTGVRECTVPDPVHDGVMVSSYCGDLRLTPTTLPERVVVSVCDDTDECIESAAVVPQDLAEQGGVMAVEKPAVPATQPTAAETADAGSVTEPVSSAGRLVVPEESLLDPGGARAPRTRNRR